MILAWTGGYHLKPPAPSWNTRQCLGTSQAGAAAGGPCLATSCTSWLSRSAPPKICLSFAAPTQASPTLKWMYVTPSRRPLPWLWSPGRPPLALVPWVTPLLQASADPSVAGILKCVYLAHVRGNAFAFIFTLTVDFPSRFCEEHVFSVCHMFRCCVCDAVIGPQ